MQFQLVGIDGECRGFTWPVHDGGLVAGRDPGADVLINDPIVSRRHCRLTAKNGGVFLKSLGSRNPTLVNGRPLANGMLRAGDELTIGQERFLLTADAVEDAQRCRVDSDEPDTVSWVQTEPLLLSLEAVEDAPALRPKTLHDLVQIHGVSATLGGAESLAELVAGLGQALRRRFEPTGWWIALTRGDSGLTLLQAHGGQDNEMPRELIEKALAQGQGLLAPPRALPGQEDSPACTLVAPATVGGVALAVLAVRREASQPPYTEDDLRFLVVLAQSVAPLFAALERMDQLRRENAHLRERHVESRELVGTSRAIAHVRAQVNRIAPSNLSVLVTGETGTGKELVAHNLHARSTYRSGPLVVVNCAAIPRDLFESVFFGHEKGAFTGAHEASVGLIAQAHGGTLFLDEVGDLSMDNQARILRAIELGVFRPVGGKQETHVDMRVVAATNKDLAAAIRGGTFREDFYHRLSAFEIHVPPLRSRPSDIPLLARHFLELGKTQAKRPIEGFDERALEHLVTRPWPGNVRELGNCVLRAIHLAESGVIGLNEVATDAGRERPGASGAPLLSLAEMEARHIAAVLQRSGGNIKRAAEALRVSRTTLYKKLQDYDLT